MLYDKPKIYVISDAAFMIEVADRISDEASEAITSLTHLLDDADHEAIVDIVPSYRSIMVEYDLLKSDAAGMEDELARLCESHAQRIDRSVRLIEIPVCYSTPHAPDLDQVAVLSGLEPQEVIDLHSEPVYQVSAMGFTPGFPYLSGLDHAIAVPRRATPRAAVAAGSIGIAGEQTGIYPVASPGGWQIIGRTPLTLFDPQRIDPFLLATGDTVRFIPIDDKTYYSMGGELHD